ncbi:MAG: hypothetical protein HYU88_08515 [Chloroflexi bacterium]|nr:hypothetical protein [Chloroflexota bacterium]
MSTEEHSSQSGLMPAGEQRLAVRSAGLVRRGLEIAQIVEAPGREKTSSSSSEKFVSPSDPRLQTPAAQHDLAMIRVAERFTEWVKEQAAREGKPDPFSPKSPKAPL